MRQNTKEEKIVHSLAGWMAVITVVTIFAVVIFRQTVAQRQKEERVSQAMMEIQQQEEPSAEDSLQVASAAVLDLPNGMKGAQIAAGREFLTELSDEIKQAQLAISQETVQAQAAQNVEPYEQTVQEEIDAMMQDAADLGLNTLFVSLNNAYGTLWDSQSPMVSFDVLKMLYDSAHEQQLSLYGVYDLSLLAQNGTMRYVENVNPDALDKCAEQIGTLAQKQSLDGLVFDGYLNPEMDYSYYEFTQSAGNETLDEYMDRLTQTFVENAVEAVRQANPSLPVGLAVEPIWATAQQREGGMQLEEVSVETSLEDYHADTKTMVEQGICDFVVVKNYQAINSDSVSFEQISDWWNALFAQTQMSAYMGHASSKAATWQDGWGASSELADQWKIADGEEAFSGSVFNSLKSLLQNDNYAASRLTEVWNTDSEGTADLSASAEAPTPKETVQTSDSPMTDTALYSMQAEVSEEETQQEQPAGVFSELSDQYAAGNVLADMDPVGIRSVADGDTIEITAIARKGADLTVMFNGDVFAMTETNKRSGMTGYSKYVAEYEIDEGYVTSVDMGNIVVIASMNGERNSLTGARVEFKTDNPSSPFYEAANKGTGSSQGSNNSQNTGSSSNSGSNSGSNTNSGSSSVDRSLLSYQKPSLSTSKSKAIGSGTLVQVVSEQALTFPVSKNTIYPDTKCYPMPYGTMDYVVGDKVSIKDGSGYRYYYKLESGRRVYCDDVQAVTSGVSVRKNRITDMTVKANDQFTYIILKSDYPVSYLPNYVSGSMEFEFQNTVSTPGNLQLNKNPLFSSAQWNGSTLKLDLLSNNGFLGYKGYHENGNIVLRFNNPTGIKGARIVVDPGHGGGDPGVADNIDSNWPEKRVNWEFSKAITQALRDRGAEVKLLETYNKTTSLDSRLSQAKNFDASLFLCIHSNSSEVSKSATGSECYYFYPFSKSIAAKMSAATSKGLSTNDRGAKYDVFYVNRDPQFVSILSEIGFLTNNTEYSKMQKSSYHEKVGESVADMVENYLKNTGIEYCGRTGTQSTGTTLNASNGPASTENGTASSQGSSSSSTISSGSSSGSSSNNSSSSNSNNSSSNSNSNSDKTSNTERPSAPVSETVVSGNAKPTGDGKVKYIIFTDPENKKLSMEVGDEKKLGIRISGDDSVQRKYTTSDKYVATIDKNGVVTAVGEGSCKITVVAGDQGGSIDVKVKGGSTSSTVKKPIGNGVPTDEETNSGQESNNGYVPITSIRIRAARNYVNADNSIQLEAVFYPSNATQQEIVWSITRGKIYGSVDEVGVFTGIESGFSTVKATTKDGAYSATYRMEIM